MKNKTKKTSKAHNDGAQVRSVGWLVSESNHNGASSGHVASQRSGGCDNSSLTPCYKDRLVTLYNCRCEEMWQTLASLPLVLLDPPFDKWASVPWWPNTTKICFTNWQNRGAVEAKFGKPRCEIVWHFRDGRWVSHEMPRITHESILVYGPTESAYVGAKNEDTTPVDKGSGCVGRDRMPERVYTPRERKALNSVLEYPRNVSGTMGCWGKPVELMRDLIAWSGAKSVADPYAGTCSAAIAARQLGVKVVATEESLESCRKAAQRLSQQELIAV